MKTIFCDILTQHRPELVETIDPENGLLNHLVSLGVFTKRQAKTIEVLRDPYKQNEHILDFLYKRPDDDYDKFCRALELTNQTDVVSKLLKPVSTESSGVIQPIESRFGQPSDALVPTATSLDDVIKIRNFNSEEEHFDPRCEESVAMGVCFRNSRLESEEGRNIKKEDRPNDCAEHKFGPRFIEKVDVPVTSLEFYQQKKTDAYPMNRRCRGKCFIFNVHTVVGMPPRRGCTEDQRLLTELFTLLHFEVVVPEDLTAQGIMETVAEIASSSERLADQCLVLFFLSHGSITSKMTPCGSISVECIYSSDGIPLETDRILDFFTDVHCMAMKGKPKLVVFQACRASTDREVETDAVLTTTMSVQESLSDEKPMSLKDFVICFPTQSGFRSFRDTQNGSWYINAIVQVFMESAHNMDVCAMLRKVNGMVSEWLPVGVLLPSGTSRQQVASHVDSLTKPYLFFFPGVTDE